MSVLESASLVVTHLGKGLPYAEGMRVMRERIAALEADAGAPGELLLLEHAPTITVTRSGGTAHVLVSPEDLADDGIELFETDRGGDVTFHGPGQLVGYPVVRLSRASDGRADLVGYLRALEGGLVAACRALGVPGAHRREGMTGVWVTHDTSAPIESWPDDRSAEKLVAIGVGVKHGVTRHGFALNVDIALERFTSRIVPCGLHGRGVTSLARELGSGRLPDEETLRSVVTRAVAAAFGVPVVSEPHSRSLADREQKLDPACGAHRPDGALYG